MPHFGLAHDLYITMGSLLIQEWLNQKKSYRNFFLLRLYLIVKRCQNAQTPNLQISKNGNFSENSLMFASTGIPMPRKSFFRGIHKYDKWYQPFGSLFPVLSLPVALSAWHLSPISCCCCWWRRKKLPSTKLICQIWPPPLPLPELTWRRWWCRSNIWA